MITNISRLKSFMTKSKQEKIHFALPYGLGTGKLKETFPALQNLPVKRSEEASVLLDKFYKMFPGVRNDNKHK